MTPLEKFVEVDLTNTSISRVAKVPGSLGRACSVGLKFRAAPVPRKSVPPRSRALLLIEPDDRARGIIRLGLEKQGYRVVETTRGERGVELADQFDPEAILLNLDLPDLSGWTAVQRIRQHSHAPILLFSDQTDRAGVIRAPDLGPCAYLSRPFTTKFLLAQLRAILRHHTRSQKRKARPCPRSQISRGASIS